MDCFIKITTRTIFSVQVRQFFHILHRLEEGRIDLVLIWVCDLIPWVLFIYLLASLLASRRGALVQHAVTVGRMAFACSMHSQFLPSENAVTLHQKCAAEKLDWARKKHAPVTHLCPCTDASKSALRGVFFFFNICQICVHWEQHMRTDPSVTAGLGFLLLLRLQT